jgi:alpha-L-rhamnosidase
VIEFHGCPKLKYNFKDFKIAMMKRNLCLLLAGIIYLPICIAQPSVKNLRCENRMNPLGIDLQNPRFSWQMISDHSNAIQSAYEIRVRKKPGSSDLWNSGKKLTAKSIFVPYAGTALQSCALYYWQVRIWDDMGKVSSWSDKAFWQMGLLQPSDWKAKWIESGSPADTVNGPAQLFRKQFDAGKKIISATAIITTHGIYEAFINGKRIGDAFLTPGWTSYTKRLQYQVYDVSNLLIKGSNTIGVQIGSGWYRTPLAWMNNKNTWGKKTGLLLQLEINYQDGSKETIISDGSWKTSDGGPLRFSEIYDGEIYDARMEKPDWNKSGYDDAVWQAVSEKEYAKENLLATYNEPIRKHEVFHPVKIFKTPAGEQVIDFGQNLVGWAQFKVRGKSGDELTVDHAEVLDKNGNFYTENLRAAKARDIYILSGKGEEVFEPHFTFQGFRYIRVKGYPGEIKKEDISAVTLYSDMETTGQFSCSNPLLNQLQHNIQWGQKGNFLDVPTDCPQRDERLGWTGDAQAFSGTAAFNMGVHNFFSKWLKDLAADQGTDGRVPHVIPNVLKPQDGGSAGWADASTIIPWNMWLAYGDKKILEDQYASMKSWIGFMQSNSQDNLWNKGFHFGDWLFYRPDDDNDGRAAVTDKYLIAQCFYANSVQLLLNTAMILNKQEDVAKYRELLKQIKDAFILEYLTPSGRLVSGTQTAYVLALHFDMLPVGLRAQAAKRLVTNIESYGDHLTTGFLGTPFLCDVLSQFGYDTVAYKLLLQVTYPSWLYPVKMGATTIWERWDGQKPDSSFQVPTMNSFNHYAYGAIGDWMYRTIAGVDIAVEGYKAIKIQPHTGGNLSYANADLETVYGKLSVHWKIADGKFLLDAEIPANTSAEIYIPASSADDIMEKGGPLSALAGLVVHGKEGKWIVLQTGSGIYHFSTHL